jgi:hypothetical protein
MDLITPLFVCNCNSPILVTPAQAGVQGIKRDLSTTQSRVAATFRIWSWVLAGLGGDKDGG